MLANQPVTHQLRDHGRHRLRHLVGIVAFPGGPGVVANREVVGNAGREPRERVARGGNVQIGVGLVVPGRGAPVQVVVYGSRVSRLVPCERHTPDRGARDAQVEG